MNSIMQNEINVQCYFCGKQINLERHHVMAGIANRKLSEKYGLYIWLCHECHIGKNGAQYNKEKNVYLKKQAQKAFEEIYGHDKWMSVFMKSYL